MKPIFFAVVFSTFLLHSCGTQRQVNIPDYNNEEVLVTSDKEMPSREDTITEITIPEAVLESIDNKHSFHEHILWTELLQANVTEAGWVNYKGMVKDSSKLNNYLRELSSNSPDTSWTFNEQKAFWINAYNAFTVKLIVDNYPVKTIKELGGSIYKVNTPWDIKFIKIGDETYDLNNIEHSILRKKFPDPRIHSAVNCASISCPKLLDEAFIAENLEEQLTNQMRAFVNDDLNNTITPTKMTISKIFSWFSGDFTEELSIREYINQFTDVEITKNTAIKYRDYDWRLNEAD